MNPRPRTRLPRLAAGLVLGAAVVAGLVWFGVGSGDSDERVGLQCHEAQRMARRAVGQQVWQTRGRPYLADLRREEEEALNKALTPVNNYFARAGESTGRFTKAVLSWDAQWSLVTAKAATLLEGLDRLPKWLQWRWLNRQAKILATVLDRRSFHKYVQRQLEQHVMSRAGIQEVVVQAVGRYQLRLDANDTALLGAVVPLKPADAANAKSPPAHGPLHLETLYQATEQGALHRSGSGAHAELLRTLVARLGTKLVVALAAYALQEGAVELGLLSAATASALWTFGVGLAVAALANVALRYVLDRIGKSPGKAIGQRLAAEVASMRRCVVEGCKRTVGADSVTITGLRTWLQRYRMERDQRRERALRRALGLAAT